MFRKHRLTSILASLLLGLILTFQGSVLPAAAASTCPAVPGNTQCGTSNLFQLPINFTYGTNSQTISYNGTYFGRITVIPTCSNPTQPTVKQQPVATQPVTPKPVTQQPTTTQPVTPKPTTQQPATTQPTTSISSFEQQVLDLTNAERAKVGLSPLKLNVELSNMARLKSQDMRDKNYFSHTSPTYGSPFQMMQQFGIQFTAAGENIAAGQTTPQQVVTGWMNSPGHRANILNANYNQIGVGYAAGGSYGHYWTQEFIRN